MAVVDDDDDDDVVVVVSVLVILDRALGNKIFTNRDRDPAAEVPSWANCNLYYYKAYKVRSTPVLSIFVVVIVQVSVSFLLQWCAITFGRHYGGCLCDKWDLKTVGQ